MVIVIFDAPTKSQRERILRRLRGAGLAQVFPNVAVGRALRNARRMLNAAVTGRPVRLVVLNVTQRAMERAVWICRREAS